jgi:hypothetical protein
LPVFQPDKVFGIVRRAKAFFKRSDDDGARGSAPAAERQRERAGDRERARRLTSERKKKLRSEIKSKKRELSPIRKEYRAATDPLKKREHKLRKKSIKQDIFQLERKLRAAKEGREIEPETGALPEFVIIGAQKGGTTFLYQLLSQHPLVEPAASKELHFFDNLFDLGTEWYRRCFPQPKWKNGQRVITGEGTPYYLSHPHAARRTAEVVPQARLIALLRNPVDRAYSHYQMGVRRGYEHLKFEEAIEAEEARLQGERDRMLEDERYDSFEHQRFSYLSRGIYVDQLVRWSEFFSKEQMLVLQSEEFFEHPQAILKVVLTFLDLPHWEPEDLEPRGEHDKDKYKRIKRNKGEYADAMDPATRRCLEEYFEPHNKRLYDYLGIDFGW